MKNPSFEQLTGRDQSHLITCNINSYEFLIHPAVVNDLLNWQNECLKSNIDFAVASAFRSYDRQLLIWNEKVLGKRTINDERGHPINISNYNEEQLLNAILVWNHIPGASRHHWGTDIDIFDATWYKAQNQKLDLQNKLFQAGGVCHQLHLLNEKLLTHNFAFYRPYDQKQGIQQELWHYSHKNVSPIFEKFYTLEVFKKNIQSSQNLLLKNQILTNLEKIYHQFIGQYH